MVCRLCKKNKAIENSHIIPAFFIKWLKETSFTEKLRNTKNIQKREQDGPKEPLLCKSCETKFSVWEKCFSERIFRPYVDDILDIEGNIQKVEELINYDENLLKFVISVQYRVLLTRNTDGEEIETTDFLQNTISIWEDYLQDKKNNTGNNRSYIFFLHSMFVLSNLKSYNPQYINWYIHRSFFKDVVFTDRRLGIVTKLGPLVLFTTLKPKEIRGMRKQMIHKKGIIDVSESNEIPHKQLETYIYFDKYKAMSINNLSEKQREVIFNDYIEKNKDAPSRGILEQDLAIRIAQEKINKSKK